MLDLLLLICIISLSSSPMYSEAVTYRLRIKLHPPAHFLSFPRPPKEQQSAYCDTICSQPCIWSPCKSLSLQISYPTDMQIGGAVTLRRAGGNISLHPVGLFFLQLVFLLLLSIQISLFLWWGNRVELFLSHFITLKTTYWYPLIC